MINANFGDYDLIQVNDNEFKKVFHSNTQGVERTFFISDKDLDSFKSLIDEIEETEDSDTKFNNIQYIENNFLV
ncbi:hypothetical protein [Liquorilactobacillus mali]|uniref:Uncharacterized protein n=1 Tax=Liquorilactobacillus mali KCTC 3596 = DSM 20444 TaxID=1046596 RepID=A0A0R2EA03_9LACO|nr:hypothetical protein [Liquorilactobacillus mali]KRN10789.1 hypothetical protein FD00_GL002031 [Liquorilactobacillus mali KCTC 3596 = DSM 20444]